MRKSYTQIYQTNIDSVILTSTKLVNIKKMCAYKYISVKCIQTEHTMQGWIS